MGLRLGSSSTPESAPRVQWECSTPLHCGTGGAMRSLIQFRVTSFALAFAFANVCLTGCAVETSTSEPAETTRTAQQAYGRPLELPILEGWDVDNLADRYPQDHSSAVNSGLSGAACLINCNTQAINCTK